MGPFLKLLKNEHAASCQKQAHGIDRPGCIVSCHLSRAANHAQLVGGRCRALLTAVVRRHQPVGLYRKAVLSHPVNLLFPSAGRRLRQTLDVSVPDAISAAQGDIAAANAGNCPQAVIALNLAQSSPDAMSSAKLAKAS